MSTGKANQTAIAGTGKIPCEAPCYVLCNTAKTTLIAILQIDIPTKTKKIFNPKGKELLSVTFPLDSLNNFL